MNLKYIASFGGGIGPDVWDSEVEISAVDFEDAAKQAKGIAEEAGGWLFEVTQSDYPETRLFETVMREYLNWVKTTFEGETVEAQFKHLLEEWEEFLKKPTDPDEIADVVMLLSCIAAGNGIDILHAFRRKFLINKARTWEKTERGWRHA